MQYSTLRNTTKIVISIEYTQWEIVLSGFWLLCTFRVQNAIGLYTLLYYDDDATRSLCA